MLTFSPLPYESKCVKKLAEARANGTTRGLVEMASGLGKTITTAFDIEQFQTEHPDTRVLVLCHRETILLQTKRKFQQYFGEEYSYGMYTGNYKTPRLTDFFFATFQTMKDHCEEFRSDAFAYIVVDEAHHTSAATYRPTVEYFHPQFLLGLTATKDRMDGQDILEVYKQTLFSMDIFDGWNQGYLAQAEYRLMLNDLNEDKFKKCLSSEESGVKLSIAQLNKTLFSERTDADIVASIREQTADLDNPTIFVFCNSIAQAKSMAHHFEGEAAMIHSDQSFQQNQAILDRFYAGDIKIILSVNMLNEGIDIPAADVVVFLRATESTTVYFQQLGRGARITKTKRTMRVLDYVANIERIAMILELEEMAKKRLKEYEATRKVTAPRRPPVEVDIPKVKFEVRKIEIKKLLEFRKSKVRGSFDSEEAFFAAVRAYASELGHPDYLSTEDIDNNRAFPCWETLRKTYKTMENFLILAGLTPTRKYSTRFKTKEAVREALQRKIFQNEGKAPTRRELDRDSDMPTITDVLRQYPSYNDALLDAGATKLNSVKWSAEKFPDAAMRQEAKKMEQELGRCPTYHEWQDNPNTCSTKVLERRYGSFNKAMESYGLTPNTRHISINPGNKKYDIKDGIISPELCQKLQDIVRKTGRKIKGTDLALKNGIPTTTYFYGHGYTIPKINQYIGAEDIILKMSVFHPLDPEVSLQLAEIVLQQGRYLEWRDMGKKKGMPPLNYFRDRGITSIDLVNAIVGADRILAELKQEK